MIILGNPIVVLGAHVALKCCLLLESSRTQKVNNPTNPALKPFLLFFLEHGMYLKYLLGISRIDAWLHSVCVKNKLYLREPVSNPEHLQNLPLLFVEGKAGHQSTIVCNVRTRKKLQCTLEIIENPEVYQYASQALWHRRPQWSTASPWVSSSRSRFDPPSGYLT